MAAQRKLRLFFIFNTSCSYQFLDYKIEKKNHLNHHTHTHEAVYKNNLHSHYYEISLTL